eukprot:scaffold15989_cov54-Attheya_sp.AAC.5
MVSPRASPSHRIRGTQKTSSMTLAITQEDASRMLEASRRLNEALTKLQSEEIQVITNQKRQRTETEKSAKPQSIIHSEKTTKPKEEDSQPMSQCDMVMITVKSEDSTEDVNDDKRKSPQADETTVELSTAKLPDVEEVEDRDETSGTVEPPLRAADQSDEKRGSAPSSPGSIVGEKKSPLNSPSGKRNIPSPTPLHKLLVRAASTCGDSMIQSFTQRMKDTGCTDCEMETSLLLFLDMDKSTKLLSAFGILCDRSHTDQRMTNTTLPAEEQPSSDKNEVSNINIKTEGEQSEADSCISKDTGIDNDTLMKPQKQSLVDNEENLSEANEMLTYEEVLSLFKCILTSISTCIHHDGKSTSAMQPIKTEQDESSSALDGQTVNAVISMEELSPRPGAMTNGTGDWTLSAQTKLEIKEIALFATDRVFEYVIEKESSKKGDGEDKAASPINPIDPESIFKNILISFEKFGEWYNKGGFKLVPWLELLDLEKWDAAGKAAAAAASATAVNKHDDPDFGLSSITEEERDAASDRSSRQPISPSKLFASGHQPLSKTLVSFEFEASSCAKTSTPSKPFHINITEDNLIVLRNLVTRSGLMQKAPEDICDVLIRHSSKREIHPSTSPAKQFRSILHRDDFGKCIRDLIPPEMSKQFDRSETDNFSDYFSNFFTCFEDEALGLGPDVVDVRELAVGFVFLCAGNKSTKLAIGFELLDADNIGYLSHEGITQYLKSYLSMLVGISLLSSSATQTAKTRKLLMSDRHRDIMAVVEHGAHYTQQNFITSFTSSKKGKLSTKNINFEDFANWYTDGGYNVAPWLELLDLTKFVSLLNDMDTHKSTRPLTNPPISSNQRGFLSPKPSPRVQKQITSDVLFTFPLANRRSLVVLQGDASYVRDVVEQLSLLSFSAEEVWGHLYKHVQKHRPPPLQWKGSKRKSGKDKSMDVDQAAFVNGMEEVIVRSATGKKLRSKISGAMRDTLNNFFQSFDLEQIDRVAANELMGGLTLLCGGKKSTKLAFAFGLFDGRKGKGRSRAQSLDGKELYLFLRSFLIVMFSCCTQSLDLSAEAVSRYIEDTAQMVADDVIRYQWQSRRVERVDFDDFGEWYNEGGFETAPWLELLDLNKWVLLNGIDSMHPEGKESSQSKHSTPNGLTGGNSAKRKHIKSSSVDSNRSHTNDECPPPPPDHAFDPGSPSFFGDDLPMDGIDDIEYTMLEQDAQPKVNDMTSSASRHTRVSSSSKSSSPRPSSKKKQQTLPPLKFHLLTSSESNSGYLISITQQHVAYLRHLVIESGLHKIEAKSACEKILEIANRNKGSPSETKSSNEGPLLTKNQFDSAMRSVITAGNGKAKMSTETQRRLSDLLTSMFYAFDRTESGQVNALELVCGFTVFCDGKKSDKLEFAFELLDQNKDGKLSLHDMSRYLCSFLNVLVSISSPSLTLGGDDGEETITTMAGDQLSGGDSSVSSIIDTGSTWAASQVFKANRKQKNGEYEAISFDDFADWYTNCGYSSMPWLELLDLRKWCTTTTAL